MSYDVYTQCRDGLRLLASNVDYRATEAYRECCSNVVVRDRANNLPDPMPDDDELCAMYGVKDRQMLDSAVAVGACLALGLVCLIVALITH
jgi:hypothetical protein